MGAPPHRTDGIVDFYRTAVAENNVPKYDWKSGCLSIPWIGVEAKAKSLDTVASKN
jgi:hypothetical protein